MVNPRYGKELFAWVSDDDTGVLGIPCSPPVDVKGAACVMPLVTSQRDLAEGRLREWAAMAAEESGKPIQLLHFTFAAVLDELPRGTKN